LEQRLPVRFRPSLGRVAPDRTLRFVDSFAARNDGRMPHHQKAKCVTLRSMTSAPAVSYESFTAVPDCPDEMASTYEMPVPA